MSKSVLLLSDVPGLGQVGDICNAREGYIRNYLIPQRLAIYATSDAKKRAERQKEQISKLRESQLSNAKKVAETLGKVGLEFERAVGMGGRLFGSVTPQDIADELTEKGAAVEKRSILMSGPIRTLGDHVVRVRVHSKVIVDIPVKISPTKDEKSDSDHPEFNTGLETDAEPVANAADEDTSAEEPKESAEAPSAE